jgi:hypothetical protein
MFDISSRTAKDIPMTYHDLQRKLHENPFVPFRIRLVNNSTYDITDPWMVTIGESSAVVVTQVRKDDKGYELALDWKTISIAHMLEFSDLPTKERKRKLA